MRATLAMEILMEARREGENLGEVKKKEFVPKYDVGKLEDYGDKPPEGS